MNSKRFCERCGITRDHQDLNGLCITTEVRKNRNATVQVDTFTRICEDCTRLLKEWLKTPPSTEL